MGEQHRLRRLDVGRARAGRRSPRARRGRRARARSRAGRRPAGRWPGAARGAGRSRPGRCATGRCGACRRPDRSARPAPTRGSGGRPRGPGPRRASRPRPPRPGRSSPADAGPRPRRRVSRPARPSPRTWAIEPARSSAARARSMSTERVKSATRWSFSSANRPPQSRIVPPCAVSTGHASGGRTSPGRSGARCACCGRATGGRRERDQPTPPRRAPARRRPRTPPRARPPRRAPRRRRSRRPPRCRTPSSGRAPGRSPGARRGAATAMVSTTPTTTPAKATPVTNRLATIARGRSMTSRTRGSPRTAGR